MLKIDSICLADNPNIILILLLDKLKMQTTDQEEPSPLYTTTLFQIKKLLQLIATIFKNL